MGVPIRPRLPVQDRHRGLIEAVRFLPAVPDGRDPHLPELGQGSDHEEHDALQGRVVEVDAVGHRQVEQVLGKKPPIRR